jgi:hypothetical protein
MTTFKSAALAVLVTTLVAAPAFAGEIRVTTAGKTTEQLHTEIVKAASKVCWEDARGQSLAVYIYPECVRRSVNTAVAQMGDDQLVAYNAAHPAKFALASR